LQTLLVTIVLKRYIMILRSPVKLNWLN